MRSGFVGLFAALVLSSCQSADETEGRPDPSSTTGIDGPGKVSSASGRDSDVLGTLPSFEFTDQTGNRFGTEQLRGQVWIANFVFTTCQGTCPVQTKNFAQYQQTLASDTKFKNVRMLSFSVQPEIDTPDVLADYAAAHDANPERWKFLTGPRDELWQLSKHGFHMPVADNPSEVGMPILHDSKVALVDQLGRIRGYFDGMTKEGFRALTDKLTFVMDENAPGH